MIYCLVISVTSSLKNENKVKIWCQKLAVNDHKQAITMLLKNIVLTKIRHVTVQNTNVAFFQIPTDLGVAAVKQTSSKCVKCYLSLIGRHSQSNEFKLLATSYS